MAAYPKSSADAARSSAPKILASKNISSEKTARRNASVFLTNINLKKYIESQQAAFSADLT